MTRRAVIRVSMLALGALIVALAAKFIISPMLVVGESMAPTLRSWDLGLMLRARPYHPQRGDVVSFRTADDPPLYFVKRVIALPGETIAIEHGVVRINGQRLPEPYAAPNPDWQLDSTPVPPDQVYVIGDNRQVPLELTLHGSVATRLVKARLVWHWRWRR